jgi:ER membrane protein complex subunit 1
VVFLLDTKLTQIPSLSKGFQDYVTEFARRFLTGSSAAERRLSRKASDGSLWRDTFGFHKLLVVSSSTGKVFGIDTTRGDIIWSRLLVEGSHGGVMPLKMFPFTTVSDGRQPEMILVGHRQSPSVGCCFEKKRVLLMYWQDDTSAVLYHFEALTGLDVLGDGRRRDILTGVELFRGTIADAYLLRGENKTVAIVGGDHEVSNITLMPLFPDMSDKDSPLPG